MSVAKRDYYEVLSVTRDCDDQTLKSSYRKLALQYHPDRNPDNREAEERFKEAAEAYAILSDPQKRAAYDRFGHQGVNGAGSAGFDESQLRGFRRYSRRSVRPRATSSAAEADGNVLACSAAKTSATTSRSVLRIRCGACRRTCRSRGWKPATKCQGTRRRSERRPGHVRRLPRPRRDSLPAELPIHPQNVSHLRRPRQSDPPGLSAVPRRAV